MKYNLHDLHKSHFQILFGVSRKALPKKHTNIRKRIKSDEWQRPESAILPAGNILLLMLN